MLLETANRHLSIAFKAIELPLWAIWYLIDICETGTSLTKRVSIDLWIVSAKGINACGPLDHFKSPIWLTEFFHLKVEIYFLIYNLIVFQ